MKSVDAIIYLFITLIIYRLYRNRRIEKCCQISITGTLTDNEISYPPPFSGKFGICNKINSLTYFVNN